MCFAVRVQAQILAASFLLRLQVSLIEVNSCPALGMHGAVLHGLLPNMLEEVLQRAVDPFFPGSVSLMPRLNSFQPLTIKFSRPSPCQVSKPSRSILCAGKLSPGMHVLELMK